MSMKSKVLIVCFILGMMFQFLNLHGQDFTLTVQSHHDVDDGTEIQIDIVASGIPDGIFLDGFNGTVSWESELTFVSATAAQGVTDFSTGGAPTEYESDVFGLSFMGSAVGNNVTNGVIMTWTFIYNSEGSGDCAFVRVDGNVNELEFTNSNWSFWTAALVDGEVCGVGCDDPVEPTLSSNSPICQGNNAVFVISGTPGLQVFYTGLIGHPASPVTIGSGGSTSVTIAGATEDLTMSIFQVSQGDCHINPVGLEETIIIQHQPVAPVTTPATSITSSSFIANWNNVANATSYRLDVATDNEFNSFVAGYNNLNVGNVNQYSVDGLDSNTEYFYRVRAHNNCGTGESSTTINLTTDESVGLINIEKQDEVRIFPNPASDLIYLEVVLTETQETQISILDVTGRKVMQINNQAFVAGENTLEIPVSKLKSGIYTIQLKKIGGSAKNIESFNFIKK